jgi:hypothetical protein
MFLALVFAFVLVIASTFFSIPLLMHALGGWVFSYQLLQLYGWFVATSRLCW